MFIEFKKKYSKNKINIHYVITTMTSINQRKQLGTRNSLVEISLLA